MPSAVFFFSSTFSQQELLCHSSLHALSLLNMLSSFKSLSLYPPPPLYSFPCSFLSHPKAACFFLSSEPEKSKIPQQLKISLTSKINSTKSSKTYKSSQSEPLNVIHNSKCKVSYECLIMYISHASL